MPVVCDRVAEMGDEVHRLRPPRFLHDDGIVRPFIFREAEGNDTLNVSNTLYTHAPTMPTPFIERSITDHTHFKSLNIKAAHPIIFSFIPLSCQQVLLWDVYSA